jgi:hypothetical protein
VDGWISRIAGCNKHSNCAACVEKFEQQLKDSLYARSFGCTYSRHSGSALASTHIKASAVDINYPRVSKILVGLLILPFIL